MKESDLYSYDNISQKTLIKGDLTLDSPTYIRGRVEGNLLVKNAKPLHLFKGAQIHGDISCCDFIIEGEVKGLVKSSGTVTIKASAVFEGDLEAQKLIVMPGSVVNGSLKAAE